MESTHTTTTTAVGISIMNKIVSLLSQNSLLVLLILIMLIVSWNMPQTYWAFVDDGEIIEISQKMKSSQDLLWKGQVFEWLKDPQAGRFRPVYWLFHYATYLLFDLNRFGHGLMQLLLLWTSSLMCYLTAKKISKSKLAGFLAGIFFVANTLNQENWYRLGPQEAPMLFFFSAAVYFLVSYILETTKEKDLTIKLDRSGREFFKRVFKNSVSGLNPKNIFRFNSKIEGVFYCLALVFTFFGYFTKENSLAFLVFPILLFLWIAVVHNVKVKFLKPKIFFYLIFNLLVSILVRYGAIRNYTEHSYASDYIFNLASIWSNFTFYAFNIWKAFAPILIVVFVYLVVKFVQVATGRKLSAPVTVSGIILITSLSFFVIQLPWRYAIPRYLLPGFYFFALVMGLILDKVIQNLLNAKKSIFFKMTGLVHLDWVLHWGVWFLIITVVIYNLAMMGQYIKRVYSLANNFNRPLISNLAEKVGSGGRVILDTPPGTAVELKQEIGLHLRLFWDRPDIKVEYFEKAGKLYPNDVLLRAGELRQVSKDTDFSRNMLEIPNRIDIRIDNKLYYPPMDFVTNYLPQFAISLLQGHTFFFNPVIASNFDDYYWEIYGIN